MVAPPNRFDRHRQELQPAPPNRRTERRKEGRSRGADSTTRPVRKPDVGATAPSHGKLPAPPPFLYAHVYAEHILNHFYAERERERELHWMLTGSQDARVCLRTPKHRFNSNGACAAIFKLQSDPVAPKPYGACLYRPFYNNRLFHAEPTTRTQLWPRWATPWNEVTASDCLPTSTNAHAAPHICRNARNKSISK